MAPLAALLAAAAVATLEVRPTQAKPGDAVLLVAGAAEVEPTATVAGTRIRFWRTAAGWRAVAGLPVELPPGPLRVEGLVDGAPVTATLELLDPAFPAKELTVAPRYVEPPASARARIASDQRAFDAAFSRPFAPPLFEEPFERPLEGEATGRYGDLRTYNGKKQGQHYGLDLDAAVGAPVVASADGVVAMVRDNYYAGVTVLVAHGPELYSAYFHLSRALVAPGAAVRRGDRIGLAGKSGRATGPHLHWGVKVAGRWVDPESVLRLGAFAR